MYQKITILLVFIFLVFLQVRKCQVIVSTNNDLKSDIELAMAREYERVALLDNLLTDPHEEDNATIEEKHLTDIIKNSPKKLLEYYDELKKESLSKNVIPDMNNHLFEVQVLEVFQNYVNAYSDAAIKRLHTTSLKKTEIKKIEDDIKHLTRIIINQVIKPLEYEIKKHPDEWKKIDLFYNLVNGQTVDEETPEIIEAYSRYVNIFKYAVQNNMDFLKEFYEELKKYENDFRLIEDLDDYYMMITDNEWVNGSV